MGGTVVTELEKTEIWDRRCRGESLSAIARHVGRGVETIRRYVLLTGGVRPRPRTRSRSELTVAEREEISRGLAAQHSIITLRDGSGGRPRQSHVRWHAMEDESAIGRPRRNRLVFDAAGAPKRASWHSAPGCGRRWRRDSAFAGRHSRSLVS